MADISPPNSTANRGGAYTTPSDKIYADRKEAERKAYLASPAGQAAAVASTAEYNQAQQESMEALLKSGYFEYDEQGNLKATSKKSRKKVDQHEPKKKTGFLSGLTAKFSKK